MARIKQLAGLAIEQHNSPNIGGSMTGHKGVVMHIAQGTFRGTISWQMNPDQKYSDGTRVTTSSTFIVGKNRGEWAQMVDSSRIAWTQRSGSYDWLSIELAGFAGEQPTAWQIEASAQLLAWAHRTHGIALAVADHEGERGLGHHSMDREWLGVEWGHEACPGSTVINAKAAIVARAREIEGEDMPLTDDDVARIWNRDDIVAAPAGYEGSDNTHWSASSVVRSGQYWARRGAKAVDEGVEVILAGQAAILAAVRGEDPTEAFRAELDRHRGLMAVAVAEMFEGVPTAVAAELGDRDSAAVEAAVRRVLERVEVTLAPEGTES